MLRYCPQCAQPLVVKELDAVKRSLCIAEGCGFVFWENPVPVVAGLLEYAGGILLARNASWPKGVFSFVSGYLEKRESPEQAVIREVKEELGLSAEINDFIGHYTFAVKNQLIIAYALRAEGDLSLNEEIAETRLISRSQIADYDFGPLSLSARIVADWLLVDSHHLRT